MLTIFLSFFSIAVAESSFDDPVVQEINWWASWPDKELIQIMDIGFSSAPDVRIAESRLIQAQAAAVQMRAGFLPSVSASISTNSQPSDALGFGFGLSSLDDLIAGMPGQEPVEEEDDSSIFTSATMALKIGLPLDVWGSGYSSYQAGRNDFYAAEAERRQALQILSFTIANTYYDVVLGQEQLAMLQGQERVFASILQTTELRHKRGEATVLDVLQQRQQQRSLETQRLQVEKMLRLNQLRLRTLLGVTPDYDLSFSMELPVLEEIPLEQKTDWIQTRPDFQSAQFRLQAAEKRKYAAFTQTLPQFSVGGQLSRQSNYQDDPDEPWNSLNAWAFNSSVSLTLFQGGGQMAKIRSANAAVVMAEENLRKIELQAKQEVEQILLNERIQFDWINAVNAQTAAARLAYQEAQNSYLQGRTPFVTVLSTQQSELPAEFTSLQQYREMIRVRLQTYFITS